MLVLSGKSDGRSLLSAGVRADKIPRVHKALLTKSSAFDFEWNGYDGGSTHSSSSSIRHQINKLASVSFRFFVKNPLDSDQAVVDGQDASHIVRVMRLTPGDQVTLFDGSGREASARIDRISRQDVVLQILDVKEVDRELSQSICIGCALPKGDRQKYLVEKLTEVGVRRMTPLITSRTEQSFKSGEQSKSLAKLRRSVIEASKQCGRNRLMEIDLPMTLAEFLSEPPPQSRGYFFHPLGHADDVISEGTSAGPQETWLAIGPEGGFTDEEEVQALSLGWKSVSLGPRTLRIETAALCAAVWAISRTH